MYNNIEFIIACGGVGTRNYPHSKGIPHKSLMPFGDVRLIDFVLRDIVKMGGRHVTLVCSNQTVIEAFKEALRNDHITKEKLHKSGKGAIADVLETTFLPEDMDIKYVIQDKPVGTAHVLGLAHKVSHDRHGVLIFPDDLIDSRSKSKPWIQEIVDEFLKNPKKILLTGVIQDDVHNNAILSDGRIIEKPKKPANNVAGYSPYTFPKACLDMVEKQVDTFETTGKLPDNLPMAEWVYVDAINQFLDNGGEAEGYSAEMFILDPKEYRMLDTGTLPLYQKELIRELLTHSQFKEENKALVREILGM